jgi:hypothetical protein
VLYAEDVAITGTVRDVQTQGALHNVNVVVDSAMGAISDSSGVYTVMLLPGDYEVAFSHVGYKTVTKSGD